MGKKVWTLPEDEVLVGCMVELFHRGTHKGKDGGFDTGYLLVLEKMLSEKLPNANIKARPHIESRIKTMKKDWNVMYDMIYGTNTSGFGWDTERKVVTAEPAVWNTYVESHPKAAQFRRKGLWYFEEFNMIYANDRATGKDAQTAEDVLEELDHETQNGDQNAMEDDTTSMDTSATSSSKKMKRSKNDDEDNPLMQVATRLGNDLKEASKEISKSLGVEASLQEKCEGLYTLLNEIEGITRQEKMAALRKFPSNPQHLTVLYSLPQDERLDYVKTFLG